LELQGDIYSLPSISQTSFNLPTLTPTPSAVQQSTLFSSTPVAISPEFRALGDRLWRMMLDAGFEPETSRLGALFLLDLQTGEAITFGSEIAFSGMSLNKIAVMAALYRELNSPPDSHEALSLANSMICSENTATNAVLSIIGQGDPYRGTLAVNSMLGELGLGQTYIAAPYAPDPRITPQPVRAPITAADQQRAEPDPFNQMTVDQLGWLLGSIYQCATSDTGPLMSTFPGAYDARECQQMLYLMSNNHINALIEVGVPPDTRVAHKHGWIPDTHGDAGIVFTPGGDFVLVVVLHNPTWLDFSESFPLMAEISRIVYNFYNPDSPVESIRPANVPDANSCTLFGSAVVENLIAGASSG
jgi:beta-lactamase class A